MTPRRLTRVAATATTLLLATSLAACGSSGPGGSSDVAQVWALQDAALNPIEQSSIDRFNEASDAGEAKLVTFGNDPYKQRLRTAIGSANSPDVFFNWGGGNLKEYVDAGKVEDLTPLLDENPELADAFLPSVLAGGQLDGKTYGLPMRGVQPVLLFTNQKVLEGAGITEPPATWEDLLTDVDKLKAAGIEKPIALAGSQPWTELMWAEYLLDRIGGPEVFQNIRDGKGEGWNDPAVLQAMTMIKELIDRGGFGTGYQSTGYDVGGSGTLLATDKSGFHLMGSWDYTTQLNNNPEFVTSGNLGYAAFPAVEGGQGDPSNLVGNVSNFYSVVKGSQAKDAAMDYVTTALNDDTYVSDLIEAGDVMPLKNAREQIADTDNAEFGTDIYDRTANATNFQLSWDQDLPGDASTKMLAELSDLFNGAQTPEGFVSAMAGS